MPIDIAEANPEKDAFGVWDDNAEVLMMFLRLQTQWHVIPGAFIGMNYQSAEFLLKIHQVADPVAMMDDLQAMEMAALQVINKRKE